MDVSASSCRETSRNEGEGYQSSPDVVQVMKAIAQGSRSVGTLPALEPRGDWLHYARGNPLTVGAGYKGATRPSDQDGSISPKGEDAAAWRVWESCVN